jgi:CheY-like chemotaxis protein
MDGADVLATINANPDLRNIPVVIVTSAELSPGVRSGLRSASALLAKANLSRESVRGVIAQVCAC